MPEPDSKCQNLFFVVQEYWPTGRMTLAGFEAIWQRDLQHYDNLTVARMLKGHRADEPDATKPVWNTVIQALRRQTKTEEATDESPSLEELDREREQTGRFLDAMTDAELEALRVEALEEMTRVTGITASRTRAMLAAACLRTDAVLRSYLGGHLRHQGRL